MKQDIPGQIDQKPQAFVSSDVLLPVVNAWRTASQEQLTEVDAGALAADQSIGALAVFRHDFASGRQTVSLEKVPGAGPLHITKAPLGTEAESAQGSAMLEFAGADGTSGTLDLSDDTVTVTSP